MKYMHHGVGTKEIKKRNIYQTWNYFESQQIKVQIIVEETIENYENYLGKLFFTKAVAAPKQKVMCKNNIRKDKLKNFFLIL